MLGDGPIVVDFPGAMLPLALRHEDDLGPVIGTLGRLYLAQRGIGVAQSGQAPPQP